MRAVIIANGKITDFDKIKTYIKSDDFIICADGGCDYAEKLGVKPDILIGDMDSVKNKSVDTEKMVFPEKKDLTDGEIVLEYAIRRNFDEIVLLGFTGGRADHLLTNIMLLAKYPDKRITVVDEYSEIIFAKSENTVCAAPGSIISIIPINGDLAGVSTEGLYYPLDNETLYFGEGRGVSNVMLSDECRIYVKSGKGLIIKSTD